MVSNFQSGLGPITTFPIPVEFCRAADFQSGFGPITTYHVCSRRWGTKAFAYSVVCTFQRVSRINNQYQSLTAGFTKICSN